MTNHVSPQPFDRFLESLASADYDEVRSLPGSEVESASAFEEMRNYLQDLYGGVRVVASFVEYDGQVVDCIPVDQDPAVKRSNGEILWTTPPAAPPAPESDATTPPPFASGATDAISDALPRTRDQDGAEIRDQFPPDTIPMYRTTLEQLSRFRNLAELSAKAPFAAVAAQPSGGSQGRYATGEQDVACLGGASYVNVWKVFATPSFQGTFSQQWYSAVSGGTLMQTVECGWHIDAARYQGNTDPHLFVFSTRRSYDEDHPEDHVYNRDRGVFQMGPNPYVYPGAPLQFSQTDGTQIEYKMGFYLTGGAWWFYFNDNPVGYFPLAWFNNGPLVSGAQRIKFGGEVQTKLPLWSAMGSGRHASAGFGKAAYQRGAYFYPVGGGAQVANLSVAGSTTGPCYTIDITNNHASAWGTYLYFGGPGALSC